MSYFKSELKRAILSKYFLISSLLTFILIVYSFLEFISMGWVHFFELFTNQYDFIDMFILSRTENRASYLPILAPLLASIVFSSSYISDKKSGYINFIYTRITKKKYAVTKLLVNGLASGFSIVLASIISVFIISILYGFSTNSINEMQISGPFSSVYYSNKYLYLLIIICISFIFNVIFSTFSLGISGIKQNKYISFLSPFLYYILSGSLFFMIGLQSLNATVLFMPKGNISTFGFILYQIIFLIISVVLFLYGVVYADEKTN